MCYSIRHTTSYAVNGGSRLRFQIGGTINQLSVQTASTFKVHVQLIDIIDDNSVTDINFGQFDSNFLTRRGGISLTSGKRLVSTDYKTYSDNAKYTISFYMAYYIPFSGRIRIF